MLTWFIVFRWIGVAVLASICVGIAVRAMAKDWRDLRRVEVFGALANLQQWADTNGFTILLREQVWDSPFLENGCAQVAFRVVVNDRSGQRRWATVVSGRRFEVRWIKPDTFFAMSRSKHDPLGDHDLDA
jgi:hypothetical protein